MPAARSAFVQGSIPAQDLQSSRSGGEAKRVLKKSTTFLTPVDFFSSAGRCRRFAALNHTKFIQKQGKSEKDRGKIPVSRPEFCGSCKKPSFFTAPLVNRSNLVADFLIPFLGNVVLFYAPQKPLTFGAHIKCRSRFIAVKRRGDSIPYKSNIVRRSLAPLSAYRLAFAE